MTEIRSKSRHWPLVGGCGSFCELVVENPPVCTRPSVSRNATPSGQLPNVGL